MDRHRKDEPWVKLAEEFNSEPDALNITHERHDWSGDRFAAYWSAHLEQ